MRHFFDFLLITAIAFLVSSCNTKGKNQKSESDTTLPDSSAQDTVVTENAGDATVSRTVIPADQFIALLGNPESEDIAKACGLSLVYKDRIDGNGDADTELIVYGVDVEKGDKQEYGYTINCLTDHACFFDYQADTSQLASIAFKNEDDANAFVKALEDYGILVNDSSYFIPKEKVPKTVEVDSLNDYNIIYELSKPSVENGLYVIHVIYYA